MKISHIDNKGKLTSKTVKAVISVPSNTAKATIAKYVKVFLANQRQSNAHTKDRSEVSGGGRKPWRQKGTGRARHGSNRSPIWTGGGVTFGPTNNKNAKLSINKKEAKVALKAILSDKEAAKQIFTADLPKIAKTKDAKNFLDSAKLQGKVTLVSEDKTLQQAFSNLESVEVIHLAELNAFDIARGGNIVFTGESLGKFIESRKLN